MSQQDKPRELNEEDKKALEMFIITCFNLNDDIDKFQSTWAQYGFETACDYLRSEKVDKLEAALKDAVSALEFYRDRCLLLSEEKIDRTKENPNYADFIANRCLERIRKVCP